MTRDEALNLLETEPLYGEGELEVETDFVLGKLGFSKEKFERLLTLPARSHLEFKTHARQVKLYRGARKLLGRFF
ncbi:MAG: hypothetical protein ACFFD6_09005 [Candidatus Thorarchaeota archaeon]